MNVERYNYKRWMTGDMSFDFGKVNRELKPLKLSMNSQAYSTEQLELIRADVSAKKYKISDFGPLGTVLSFMLGFFVSMITLMFTCWYSLTKTFDFQLLLLDLGSFFVVAISVYVFINQFQRDRYRYCLIENMLNIVINERKTEINKNS